MDRVLFSSKSDEWETPQYLFDSLNAEFGFNLRAGEYKVIDTGVHIEK